ncbi:MAG: biopolymer transporter ExbD [Deltaproteobacteria bacterium]|nr:biopolymer transporter ExbD [Deltaproteobacteria bacterium]
MLVLLVIFMVTAPILQQGVAVDLPQVTTGALESKEESVIVSLTRGAKIHLNEQTLSLKDLQQRLSELARQHPDRPVYLRADEGVSYGKVVEVMAVIRNAGIHKLGMVTEPLRDE